MYSKNVLDKKYSKCLHTYSENILEVYFIPPQIIQKCATVCLAGIREYLCEDALPPLLVDHLDDPDDDAPDADGHAQDGLGDVSSLNYFRH